MAEVPPGVGEALNMLECAMGFLADTDPAELPDAILAEVLRRLERIDAVAAVARGRTLAAFDARDVHLGDGQRTTMAWLTHCLRLTRAQAAADLAVAGLAREHRPLLGGLRKGGLLTVSVAVLLAKWLRKIPAEFREESEELLVGAALAGNRTSQHDASHSRQRAPSALANPTSTTAASAAGSEATTGAPTGKLTSQH